MTKVTATKEAAELIKELQEEHGDLIFHLSGGCCDGSAPMCYPKGEFRIGAVDVHLDNVEGVDFYVAESTYEYYKGSDIEVGLSPGRGSSFSIEAPRGVRFLIKSTLKEDPQ